MARRRDRRLERLSMPSRVQATPVVRRTRDLDLGLDRSRGTGPGGPVTEDDAGRRIRWTEERRVPLARRRRVIANTGAHASGGSARHLGEVTSGRPTRPPAARGQGVAETLVEFPELNARLDGDRRYPDCPTSGSPVQTNEGIRPRRARRGGERSRALAGTVCGEGSRRLLSPAELRDSTFRSRAPGSRGLFRPRSSTTPRWHPGIGRVAPRAVVRDGAVAVRALGRSRSPRPPRGRRCARPLQAGVSELPPKSDRSWLCVVDNPICLGNCPVVFAWRPARSHDTPQLTGGDPRPSGETSRDDRQGHRAHRPTIGVPRSKVPVVPTAAVPALIRKGNALGPEGDRCMALPVDVPTRAGRIETGPGSLEGLIGCEPHFRCRLLPDPMARTAGSAPVTPGRSP